MSFKDKLISRSLFSETKKWLRFKNFCSFLKFSPTTPFIFSIFSIMPSRDWYSFSHFDLETEIFYGNIKKEKLSKSNWIKKSSYTNSRMPTVMKKIVEMAV